MRGMAARSRREFSADFKTEAVRGVLDGKSTVAEVARSLDIAPSVVGRWVKQAKVDAGKGPKDALSTAEKQELAQLRREVKQLRMEREILKNHPRGASHLLNQKLLLRYSERGPGGAAVSFLETTTIP
jgi:transposase